MNEKHHALKWTWREHFSNFKINYSKYSINRGKATALTYSKVWKECVAQKIGNSSNLPPLTMVQSICAELLRFIPPASLKQMPIHHSTDSKHKLTHIQTHLENYWQLVLVWWQTSKSSWAECTNMFIQCKETVARAPLPEQLSKTKVQESGPDPQRLWYVSSGQKFL